MRLFVKYKLRVQHSGKNKEASAEIYPFWEAGQVVEKGIVVEARLQLNLHVFIDPMLKNKIPRLYAMCWQSAG